MEDGNTTRVIHYADVQDKKISGLKTQVLEIMKYEKSLGIDSYLINPLLEFAPGMVCTEGYTLQPWDFATKKDIHVIHSLAPKDHEKYDKRIFLAHGTPEYSFDLEQNDTVFNALTNAMNYIHDCEYTVTLHKRHLQFWKKLSYHPKDVVYIPSGIDLERWNPMGEKLEYNPKPWILFADVGRSVKSPRDFLFAMQNVQKEIPFVKYNFIGIPHQYQLLWNTTISKLYVDKSLGIYEQQLISDMAPVYRGMDLTVSHCSYGDITRVGMESLACGTPVVAPLSDNPVNAQYREGYPDSLSEVIIDALRVWEQDYGKLKVEARQLAEKHYDITNTVKGLKKLYRKLGL